MRKPRPDECYDDTTDSIDWECYHEAADRYADEKRDELWDQEHIKNNNCDNCAHSYIEGSSLACNLFLCTVDPEQWCTAFKQRSKNVPVISVPEKDS